MEAFKVDFIKTIAQSAEHVLWAACCSFWPGQTEACIYGLVWGRGRTWPLKLYGCLSDILRHGLLPNLALYLRNSKDVALNLQRTGTLWRVGAICTHFKVPEAYLPIPRCPARPLLGLFTIPPSTFLPLRVNRKTRWWSRGLGTFLSSWQSWVIYLVLLPNFHWGPTKQPWEYNGTQDTLLPRARRWCRYWSRM